jgi:predicted ATPase/class 3 adenylate cyclase
MAAMLRDLPSGTVTFLFTDVEGSTRLLQKLGAERYEAALAEHRRVIRAATSGNGGSEVDTQGDAFFCAFPTAPGALAAATDLTAALAPGPIRVRVGIHTGTPMLGEEGYVGGDVHRAARIAAAGHGGQVLVSATTAALLGGDRLRDLGEHRLKDLSAPERLYQLGDGEFPALKSLYRTNLPVPATPFLGRERELAEVVELLAREGTRLLTLTGPGGTGKTRLALQAAGLSSDSFPDGVWWVPLAPLRDPELVLQSAGQAIGSKDGLAEHIADKRLLILFDNFEQVVAAAADVGGLLAACPNLQLLVTSREPLHLTGEQEYPVPPLEHGEAVDFFLARARAVKPDFVADGAVSRICQRLDELPLALELAAARVKALSPAQILERLEQRLPLLTGGARDLPERQRTLRGALGWSHELLDPAEQRLFARLAVFRGGCTLETAEEVAEADLDTLQSLVDKSLLRVREDRFWMLETIREYASERLASSPKADELRRRHAAHFLALAEEAEPHLPAYRREWLDRLDREHDNLRAALDQLEAAGETELAFRLAGALSRFWLMKGHVVEGRRRLERLLRSDSRPTLARGKALNGASMLGVDGAAGRLHAEEALVLHRELGDAWGTAQSQLMLGSSVAAENMARAQQLYEESARAFEHLGDEHSALTAYRGLAWACISLGDPERGRALHEENLRRARALSNERIEAITLGALAMLALQEGRVEDVVPMLKESHRLHRKIGDPLQTAFNVFRFAHLVAAQGSAETATRVLSSADALSEEVGLTLRSWDPEFFDETLATIHARLDETAVAAAWEQGRSLTADEAVALALSELDG